MAFVRICCQHVGEDAIEATILGLLIAALCRVLVRARNWAGLDVVCDDGADILGIPKQHTSSALDVSPIEPGVHPERLRRPRVALRNDTAIR